MEKYKKRVRKNRIARRANPQERCIIHAHDIPGILCVRLCVCVSVLLISVLCCRMITVCLLNPCLHVFRVQVANRLDLARTRPESVMVGFCLSLLEV